MSIYYLYIEKIKIGILKKEKWDFTDIYNVIIVKQLNVTTMQLFIDLVRCIILNYFLSHQVTSTI